MSRRYVTTRGVVHHVDSENRRYCQRGDLVALVSDRIAETSCDECYRAYLSRMTLRGRVMFALFPIPRSWKREAIQKVLDKRARTLA